MPIQISTKLVTDNIAAGTHEDVYGIGGYVVIQSGWEPTQTLTSTRINQIVPQARRKIGMQVHDVDTRQEYECVSTGSPGNVSDTGIWKVRVISGGTY